MKVTLPYDPNWTALTWAKANCPSYITNDSTYVTHVPTTIVGEYYINYYFGDDRDAAMFLLRWS